MLAGQPIAATIGIGTKADIVTAFSMDLNGNGITVSNEIWEKMQEDDPKLKSPTPPHPIYRGLAGAGGQELQGARRDAEDGHGLPGLDAQLRAAVLAGGRGHPPRLLHARGHDRRQGRRRVALGNAATANAGDARGGNDPGLLRRRTMESAGRDAGIGVPVATNYDIWKNNPEKVFGVTREWADKNPKTHIALVKALIRAGKWLDASFENREEAARILSRPDYVGADYEVIANSMTGYFYFQKTDKRRDAGLQRVLRYYATYPYYSDAIWFLTQMRRWGQIPKPSRDEWYHETAKQCISARRSTGGGQGLLAAKARSRRTTCRGTPTAIAHRPPSSSTALTYDGKKPLEYLSSFKIGNK